MKTRLRQFAYHIVMIFALVMAASTPGMVGAAPYAAIVMDARTGEILYESNADARLYPASLTKMMTLYITFEAIERGEISLDTMVTISRKAADEPPSKLGLKAGQKIQLRYLIRAAAVKSANDAATAIGEAVGGSEDQFAARMNRTAKALGMKNSTFKNANGLTRSGHLTTARDLTILGRRLFYDFPQYYNIFSRRSTNAGLAEVASTNRRFLDSYPGADGIKTGYTGPAGFNLTASAERNGTRIIATVLGGKSTADRNAKMTQLLDLGFKTARPGGAVQKPAAPVFDAAAEAAIAENTVDPASDPALQEGGAGKTIRMMMAVAKSPRPKLRPGVGGPSDDMLIAMQDGIAGALAEATGTASASAPASEADPEIPPLTDAQLAAAATEEGPDTVPITAADAAALADAGVPPGALEPEADAGPDPAMVAEAAAEPTGIVTLAAASAPRPRPEEMFAEADPTAIVPVAPEVVTRISTSGGRNWGINVGRFSSRARAESQLLKTALAETATLNDGLRKVAQGSSGYDANFVGLTQEEADLACRRLQARAVQCFTMGP